MRNLMPQHFYEKLKASDLLNADAKTMSDKL